MFMFCCRPLSEGKKVKEKFDLIFDTAKYNKCLDNIKTNKKTLDHGKYKIGLPSPIGMDPVHSN